MRLHNFLFVCTFIVSVGGSTSGYCNYATDWGKLDNWATTTPQYVDNMIKNGANVNATDDKGWKPIMYAAVSNRNPQVIETLAKNGASVNEKDTHGITPLMRAAGNNQNPQILETLIKNGADVNAKNDLGFTALMFAVMIGRINGDNKATIEKIKILLQHGADINARAGDGTKAIMLTDDTEIISFLTKNGAKK